MNPLLILGLGAVALMAMGGKKKKTEPEPEEESPPSGEPKSVQLVGRPANLGKPKLGKAVKLPPMNYAATINSQQSLAEAKQCHLQGMNNVDQITMCIANKIFPDWRWDNRSGWQNDAWARMKNVARVELGMDPIPIS